MERLTYRLNDQFDNPTDSIILKPYLRYEDPETRKKILNRLAAYEDTGMEPEGARRLQKDWTSLIMTLDEMGGMPHLHDLLQAEQAGRLVVLPCKVEPLTLDELRQMDGEPVWVQSPGVPEYGRWAIVEGVGENCLFLHDDFTCHDYGKTWLAYRQKPEEDDHETG